MNTTAKRGRPTLYTPELADRICAGLQEGKSLRSICKGSGMPARPTVHLWVHDNVDGFADRYTRAREFGLDVMSEELLAISDSRTGDVARDRLRVDTRKWYLSKLAPKRFGDKLEHSGGISLSLSQLIVESMKPATPPPDDSSGR